MTNKNIEKVFDAITYKYSEDEIFKKFYEGVPDNFNNDWLEDRVIEDIIEDCLIELNLSINNDQEIELIEMVKKEYGFI